MQKEEVISNVFPATEIPTCCRVEVVKRGDNKFEVSKKRSMAYSGMQKVRHRLKMFFSERIRMLHERGKVPPFYNNKKRVPTHNTMASRM